MRIRIDKNLVEFLPDSEQETKDVVALWQRVLDCSGFNRKLSPVGEYKPDKRNVARFHIEGD